MKITLHRRSQPRGLDATISARYDWSVARQLISLPPRHLNFRNLNLQQKSYLRNMSLDHSRFFPSAQYFRTALLFCRLASLAPSLGWLVGNYLEKNVLFPRGLNLAQKTFSREQYYIYTTRTSDLIEPTKKVAN